MSDPMRSTLLALALTSALAGCSASDGKPCGAQACGADQYCVDDLYKCGASPAANLHCEQLPQVCPAVVTQACGCDGKDYPSVCDAARSGVDVADPTGPCVHVAG